MSFEAGQKVVYPKHGVSVVQSLCQRVIDGKARAFYQIKLPVGDATVLVPRESAEANGVRSLVKKADAAKFFRVLRAEHIEAEMDWKARFEKNCTRMTTGCLFEASRILKVLAQVRLKKPLSSKEREMFDQVKALTVSELAAVTRETPESVGRKIDAGLGAYLKKNGLA